MASRLSLIVLFLHLLVLQEMMATFGEAALCEMPSRLFKGACFHSSNCRTICDKEGFLNGRCKFFKCKCSKDCGTPSGGGGGGGDGGVNPPAGGGGGDGGDGGENPPAGGDGGDSPPAFVRI